MGRSGDARGGGAAAVLRRRPATRERGARTYATAARLPRRDGKRWRNGGSVVDGAYLALVSDQALRTAVVVGRRASRDARLAWRAAGTADVTAQEVADVVAWLIAQRPEFPGQPYPKAATTKGSSDG